MRFAASRCVMPSAFRLMRTWSPIVTGCGVSGFGSLYVKQTGPICKKGTHATTSKADIEMTREIASAANALRIAVHDHIVVGRGGTASFRAPGLL